MSSLRWLLVCGLLLFVATAHAQNIQGHYVSKSEEDGDIYYTFPQTLFKSRTYGDLTFDVTYKEQMQGRATLNFTYSMPQMTPADSVQFAVDGKVVMSGAVKRLYTEPGRKSWMHRYSVVVPVEAFATLFDAKLVPEVRLYSRGEVYLYPAKRKAWSSYAPIGYRIIEMIRVNEKP